MISRVHFPASPGATRKQRDLLAVGVLLNAGLTGQRLVRAAAMHPARALRMARLLRHLRISPAALCDLMAHCDRAELPVVLGNLIRSRRWDAKARRKLAKRQKGGCV